MPKVPIPDLLLESIYELKSEQLHELGITLLLMDLDNTLDRYNAYLPTVPLRNWIDRLRAAGIEPFIYSNSKDGRAKRFADALSIDFIHHARKPRAGRLLKLLKEKNLPPEQAAIIGDQIYTDILCGARAGILTIAVRPIDMHTNPFHALRFAFELPFRAIAKKRAKLSVKKD